MMANEAVKRGLKMGDNLIISKQEAARRQLETAIYLYFHEGDPVSIHTLTAAAYNILRDVSVKRGNLPMLVKGYFLQCIKPGHEKEVRDKINEAENFFKHANRDTDGILTFNPGGTEILLIDACIRYYEFTSERPPELFLFHLWFMLNFPEFFILPSEIKTHLEKYVDYRKYGRNWFYSNILPQVKKLIELWRLQGKIR
ncbi:MAG: hypothetical protein ABIG94_11760 [Pseudomonadota bacterium]